MNILITGGMGFIGFNLLTQLRKNHTITIIDNLSTSNKKLIDNLPNDVIYYNLDLSDKDNEKFIENIVSQNDVCYHLAGSVGVKYVTENPSSTLHNSFNINNIMFPIFEKYQTKVIYASTSEVYGETDTFTGSKETDTLKIGCPETSRWGYACQKLMSEFLLKSYTFPNVIVRFFNVTGKGQLSDYGMVMPNFVERAKNNTTLYLYGSEEKLPIRSFCDIRDAVAMLELLLDFEEHNNKIYNIGNDNNVIKIKDLAEMVVEELKSKSTIEFTNYEIAFNSNFGEIYNRIPNIDRIKKYYTPKYTVRDIIRSLK